MSGWLMLGLPGALYVSGLAESWIAIGLFLGAWANWVLVAPRLRAQTEQYDDSLTIPEFLGNRFADDSHILRIVASLGIVVFFAVYSASGLVRSEERRVGKEGVIECRSRWSLYD